MNILLITHKYPYTKTSNGETFLDPEINAWSKQPEAKIIICPKLINDGLHKIPSNIQVDTFLAQLRSNKRLLLKRACSVLSLTFIKIFVTEVITQRLLLKPKRLLLAARSMVLTSIYYKTFSIYLNKHPIDCMYSYWYEETTNALCLLKERYKFSLITRAHGVDLGRTNTYFPFRKQLAHHLDTICLVSEGSQKIMQKQLPELKNICVLSRLGVEDNGKLSPASANGLLTIVSCSALIKIKQVHKIIESIYFLAKNNSELTINWQHMGSGALEMELKNYAKKLLSTLANVEYQFKGMLSNKQVHRFYQHNPVDVFIHLSAREGCPVAVQEALSYGIPVVGFNVNGTSETVRDTENGFLLPQNSSAEQVAVTLSEHHHFFKQPEVRKKSYLLFKQRFDAKKNHSQFQQNLIHLTQAQQPSG